MQIHLDTSTASRGDLVGLAQALLTIANTNFQTAIPAPPMTATEVLARQAPPSPAPAAAPDQATVSDNGASAQPSPDSSGADGAVATTPVTAAPSGNPAATVAPVTGSDVTAKRGPGRPRKNAEAPAPAPAAEATPASSTTPAGDAQQPAASAPSAPSADDLRNALKAYTEVKNMQAGLDLLKSFGATRISDLTQLPVEKQREFVAACAPAVAA